MKARNIKSLLNILLLAATDPDLPVQPGLCHLITYCAKDKKYKDYRINEKERGILYIHLDKNIPFYCIKRMLEKDSLFWWERGNWKPRISYLKDQINKLS